MAGGIIFTAIGFYILYYSFERGPVFRRMSGDELENWRATKQKPVRIVGIIMIITGISQAAGLLTAF